MGLVTGGLNGRRFRITTPLPPQFREVFLASVREHAFVGCPTASDSEPHLGWVDVFEPANTSFELNTFLFDRFCVLTMRIDKKTVNGRYLKIATAERFAHVMEERNIEKLSKDEKTMISEALEAELHARSLPSVNTVDVAWDTHTGEVIVFSTSDAVIELVAAHFEETFDTRIRPERQCEWLADKFSWEEIAERVKTAVPQARGEVGLGSMVDGWHEDDPLEGAELELASDFITWLWLQSEAHDGLFRVIEGGAEHSLEQGDSFGTALDTEQDDDWNDITETLERADITLWLESKLKLQEVAEADKPETTILLGEAPSTTPTARHGMSMGKRPIETRLGMKLNDLECGMTLTATPGGLQIAGLKLPFEVKKGTDEKIFERMMLLEMVHTTTKKLYQQFFLARTSPAWERRVSAWLQDDLAAK